MSARSCSCHHAAACHHGLGHVSTLPMSARSERVSMQERVSTGQGHVSTPRHVSMLSAMLTRVAVSACFSHTDTAGVSARPHPCQHGGACQHALEPCWHGGRVSMGVAMLTRHPCHHGPRPCHHGWRLNTPQACHHGEPCQQGQTHVTTDREVR